MSSGSDAVYWRAYASAIKGLLGIDDLGKGQIVFVAPVTQRAIDAGKDVPKEVSNYLIYKFADSLLSADFPVYAGGSSGSYIKSLNSYFNWIETNHHGSPTAAIALEAARKNATLESERYDKEWQKAFVLWKSVKELLGNPRFAEWSIKNSPGLSAAKRARELAYDAVYDCLNKYYGPDATRISSYLKKIVTAQDFSESYPGLNMPGITVDAATLEDLKALGPNTQTRPESTIWLPSYSIPGLSSKMDEWRTDMSSGRPQTIRVDSKAGISTSWKDYGFQNIDFNLSFGSFPIFSVTVIYGGVPKRKELDLKGREDAISLDLSAKGIQKFDIQAGEWDVPNIKAMFPKQRLGAPPEVLSSRFARVTAVLIGYDVALGVHFNDSSSSEESQVNGSSLYDEAFSLYEEARITGGSVTILGFQISFGTSDKPQGSLTMLSDYSAEKSVEWSRTSGRVNLCPNVGQRHGTLLGVSGSRI